MIRNAVIHIMNEQPLLADLFALPTANDAGLVCTNVRTLDGKRPIFIDSSDATFFFPYLHIRFIELPSTMDDGTGSPLGGGPAVTNTGMGTRPPAPAGPVPDDDNRLPVPVGAADDDPGASDDLDIELDEDFLRRIRDV